MLEVDSLLPLPKGWLDWIRDEFEKGKKTGNLNLSGSDLSLANIETDARMTIDLSRSCLEQSALLDIGCDLDLSESSLDEAVIRTAKGTIPTVNIENAQAKRAVFVGPMRLLAKGADLEGADLSLAELTEDSVI